MFLLEMDPDDAVIHEDDVEFTHELAHEMVENGTHSRLSSALADVECSCHEQRAMDYDEIKWLEEHGIKFRLDAGGCWEGEPYVLIELFDREHAILFKLAFGGS